MNYYDIFKRFNELKLDYLIVGGLAVNLHGIPRMTYDIDIMIKLDRGNVSKLVNQLKEWGYRLKIPVKLDDLKDIKKLKKWIKEKNLKAINFYNDKFPIAGIDIVIDSPVPYEDLKERAIYIELLGEKLPVISIEDLIYIKEKAGRKQDLADARHLKKLLQK